MDCGARTSCGASSTPSPSSATPPGSCSNEKNLHQIFEGEALLRKMNRRFWPTPTIIVLFLGFIYSYKHQLSPYNWENHNDNIGGHPSGTGSGAPLMHLPQSYGGQSLGHLDAKVRFAEAESVQMQHFTPSQQLAQSHSQPGMPLRQSASNHISSEGGVAYKLRQRTGFTKEHIYVLKAQLLAFMQIKRGDRILPEEVLQSIAPPPFDLQQQQQSSYPSRMANL